LNSKGDKNVVFLFDTGSSHAHLCIETLDAFLGGSNIPNSLPTFKIHGYEVDPQLSTAHFADINVLGTNFLKNYNLHFQMFF